MSDIFAKKMECAESRHCCPPGLFLFYHPVIQVACFCKHLVVVALNNKMTFGEIRVVVGGNERVFNPNLDMATHCLDAH